MDVRVVGRLLKQVSDRLAVMANADLKKLDLTLSQSKVLLFLEDQPDKRATQRELELHLRVSHATVHGLLARLDSKGLVRIVASEEDRRMRVVELNTASQVIAEIREQQRRHMQRLIREMDEEQVLHTLQQMLDNLERYQKNGD